MSQQYQGRYVPPHRRDNSSTIFQHQTNTPKAYDDTHRRILEYSNQRREIRDDRRHVNTGERDINGYESGKYREETEILRNSRRYFSQRSNFNTQTIPTVNESDQKEIESEPIEIPEMIIPPVIISPEVNLVQPEVSSVEMALEEKENVSVETEKKLPRLLQYERDLIRKLSVIRAKHERQDAQAINNFILLFDEWIEHYEIDLEHMYEICVDMDLAMSYNRFV